jgi:hypothetical protein
MKKFEEFKQEFNEKFETIYEYIDNFNTEPFGGKLINDNDDVRYDSYGNEESDLERVIYFEKYDINVMFNGTRCSYDGEEWYEMKEVKPIQKTITVWQ